MTDLGLHRHPVEHPIIFSHPGALTADVSPPWPPTHDGTIHGLRVTLGDVGSTSSVFTVYVNGTSVGTVTLGSSVADNDAAFTAAVTTTDFVTVAATTRGTGAGRALALLRFA